MYRFNYLQLYYKNRFNGFYEQLLSVLMLIFNNINMVKIFELKKDKLKLKIEINEYRIITSWLHYGRKEYSNHREFDICMIEFAFDTLKPVCDKNEYDSIRNFIFNNKKEGEQLSLF